MHGPQGTSCCSVISPSQLRAAPSNVRRAKQRNHGHTEGHAEKPRTTVGGHQQSAAADAGFAQPDRHVFVGQAHHALVVRLADDLAGNFSFRGAAVDQHRQPLFRWQSAAPAPQSARWATAWPLQTRRPNSAQPPARPAADAVFSRPRRPRLHPPAKCPTPSVSSASCNRAPKPTANKRRFPAWADTCARCAGDKACA